MEETMKEAKSACNWCGIHCGLDICIKNDRVVKVGPMQEHPFNQLCVKAKAIIDLVYSKDRVTTPMVKASGKWQPVSWDTALGIIADKLYAIRQKYGAKCLAVHLGFPFIGTPVFQLGYRFCDAYGSPNFTSGASVCHFARQIAQSLTFDHNGILLAPHYRNTKCHVVWGANPTESSVLAAAAINKARKQGAKLIVIDPRVTLLAKKADIYAQIKPGTDLALALGLLNVVIEEKLYNQQFVENWTYGFDKLERHATKFPPEKIAKVTWVAANTIRDLARTYATNFPACITQGVSLDHCISGVQTSRAIACLTAICGNFDVPGGSTFVEPPGLKNLRLREDVTDEIGASYPLFSRFVRESSSTPISNAILTHRPYPIKALIISGCNPLLTWPETTKVKEAFERLDLLVVMDLFMNETAQMADVFLPAATFVESSTLRDYALSGLGMLQLTQQAIRPVGNSWPDWKFWVQIGRKMGYEHHFPWSTDDELYASLLEPTGLNLKQLKEKPGTLFYGGKEQQRFLRNGFGTPTGKVELYSGIMEQHGYDPLPTPLEREEPPVLKLSLAEKHSLVLITGARIGVYAHSQFRNLEVMRRRYPEPLAQVNTGTARALGIDNGDMIEIETSKGNVQMRAWLSADIHPNVVSIPHGWAGVANANLATSDEQTDPISGFPAYKSIFCRVKRIK